MTDDRFRDPFDDAFDGRSEGSVEGHLSDGGIWGSAPQRPARDGIWGRDLGGAAGPVDAAVLARTDALLDRLGERRQTADDLDDPAVAVLALLAAEVDLHTPSPDRLRRELFDRGVWPLVPGGTPPSSFLPETEVLDLRSLAGGAYDDHVASDVPAGGPSWRSGDPAPTPLRAVLAEAARVPAPRQVRVRLIAVAAVAVLGLYGLGVAVTGAFNPFHAGAIIAGVDGGTRLESELTAAIGHVQGGDVAEGKATLASALDALKHENLTAQQRKNVYVLIHRLKAALESKGVVLTPAERARVDQLPTPDGVTPFPSETASGTPTDPTTDPSASSSSSSATDSPSASSSEPSTTPSGTGKPTSSTTKPTSSATTPPSTTKTKGKPTTKGNSPTTKRGAKPS